MCWSRWILSSVGALVCMSTVASVPVAGEETALQEPLPPIRQKPNPGPGGGLDNPAGGGRVGLP